MLEYEEIKLEMVGAGGAGSRPVVEIVEDEIRRIARLVHDDGRADAGTVTLKIRVKAEGESTVVLEPRVSVTEPARDTRALSAILCGDGSVVAVQHKQQDLPGVVPLRGERGERGES